MLVSGPVPLVISERQQLKPSGQPSLTPHAFGLHSAQRYKPSITRWQPTQACQAGTYSPGGISLEFIAMNHPLRGNLSKPKFPDPLYEHYNDNTDNFSRNIYGGYWIAQTFNSPITHLIQKVCFKGYRYGDIPKVATISIQGVDGAGKPDGVDLTFITFSTHLFKLGLPAEWQCIDLPEHELTGGIPYAIVVRVPTAVVGDRLVWRTNTAGTYPNGTGVESTNGGVTWTVRAPWDFQFEEWGEPPAPPPPPGPPTKWACLSLTEICLADGYTFEAITNKPIHLWLRLTDQPYRKHMKSEVVRGETKMTDLRFCFTQFSDIEQEEAGDTLEHTFIVRDWPVPETRYFYLLGTENEVPSPSTSNIFEYHFPPSPYRNELTGVPTSSDRVYSDQGLYAIFYPPMDVKLERLAACLSKKTVDDPPVYPEKIFLEVRTAPALDECGVLLKQIYINCDIVPVDPDFRWFAGNFPRIVLQKGQPYAFIIRSSEPFGATKWGMAARMQLTECIMHPSLADSFIAADPCQEAVGDISPLFLASPKSVGIPSGTLVI